MFGNEVQTRYLRSVLQSVPIFENELQTRCAICGTGILPGLVFVLAHLRFILLIVPVVVLFPGLVADLEKTHAVWSESAKNV